MSTTAITFIILFVLIAWFVKAGIRVVQQQSICIVETFGKFSTTLHPGLNFIIPFVQRVVGKVDLRITEVKTAVEVKTKNNVFVDLPITIQLRVNETAAANAFYKLQDPSEQISSWILNSVRSVASGMQLEDLFEDKEHIVNEINTALVNKISSFGYKIEALLIDQPTLRQELQNSFNKVVASQREAEAAQHYAVAIKTREIGKAEAEAESQKIRARGMAEARKILATGMAESVQTLEQSNVHADYAVTTLVELNRLDVMRECGATGNTIIFDSPSNSGSSDSVTKAILAMQKAADKKNNPAPAQ